MLWAFRQWYDEIRLWNPVQKDMSCLLWTSYYITVKVGHNGTVIMRSSKAWIHCSFWKVNYRGNEPVNCWRCRGILDTHTVARRCAKLKVTVRTMIPFFPVCSWIALRGGSLAHMFHTSDMNNSFSHRSVSRPGEMWLGCENCRLGYNSDSSDARATDMGRGDVSNELMTSCCCYVVYR